MAAILLQQGLYRVYRVTQFYYSISVGIVRLDLASWLVLRLKVSSELGYGYQWIGYDVINKEPIIIATHAVRVSGKKTNI